MKRYTAPRTLRFRFWMGLANLFDRISATLLSVEREIFEISSRCARKAWRPYNRSRDRIIKLMKEGR